MNTLTASRAGPAHWIDAALAALRHAVQRARDAAQLSQLDERALRDLGLSRSELDSCHAESARHAEATRRRIAMRDPGGAGA